MILILLLIFLVFCLLIINNICKSGFEENKSTSIVKGGDKLNTITDDTVLIFYAPWCGYCKKSMDEFEKAVEEGNGNILLINSDAEDNKDLLKKHKIEGFPTIVKGNGTVYNGDRTSKDIVEFSNDV